MTLDEIAKLAGTSKSTVSRVMTNHPRISEKTRKRVMAIVEKQHYRPNLFARALAGGKTGLIGVISSNIGSGFYAEVIRGIDLVFNRMGKRLLVSFAHFGHDYEALWRDIVTGGRVEGLIVVAPTSEFFQIELDTSKIPTVICAGNPPKEESRWKRDDRVGMNNAGAMDDLIASLSEQGYQRILHAAGWSNNSDAVDRRTAFKQACRKYRLQGDVEHFGIVPTDGRQAMEKYLGKTDVLPDAIVCFNDSIAIGILEAWHAHTGKNTPPPFALTGWDDSPTTSVIGLTSVSIPFSTLGEASAELLDHRINHSSTIDAQKRLIELSVTFRSSSLKPVTRKKT